MTIEPSTNAAKRGPYAKTVRVRAQIVDAATNVFAARGYHGGSLRDIARHIDIAPTSLIHHFGSKIELLQAVLEHANNSAEPWYSEHADERGLKAAILELIEFNYSRPELLRLLAILSSEASSPEHPAHEWFTNRYRTLAAWISSQIHRDMETGRVVDSLRPDETAPLIIGLWDGLQLQWLLDDRTDMVRHMARALDVLLPDGPSATQR